MLGVEGPPYQRSGRSDSIGPAVRSGSRYNGARRADVAGWVVGQGSSSMRSP
jgi:hypothetical protein